MKKFYLLLLILLISIIFINCSRKNKVIATFDGGVVRQKEIDFYISKFPKNKQKEYLGSIDNLKEVVKEIAKKKVVFNLAKRTNIINLSNILNEFENYKKKALIKYMMKKLNHPKKAKVKLADIEKYTSSMVIKLIWLKTYSGMSEKAMQEIKEKALKIKKLLKQGADFGELANKYSDDPGNFKGGNVGPVNINEIPKELANKLFTLKQGEMSDIFKTSMGYEIVKLISFDRKSKPPKVSFKHILITTNNKTSAQAFKKAQTALKLLKKGIDFSLVANEFTEDPSNFRNGEIPKFKFSRIYYPIANTAYNLKPGKVSDIIETKFGYFIVKLESIKKLSAENIKRLKRNKRFLERIKRTKEYYLKSKEEYYIKRRIRRGYKIVENYSLLTNKNLAANSSVVVWVKDLNLKITYDKCIDFISSISGPTFKSDFIAKQEKVYNSLVFPEIAYDFALRKKIDKDEEFILKMDEYLYNMVYKEFINSLSWSNIKPTLKEMRNYYKKNESRYYITKVVNGKPKRVKQSFSEAKSIVKRHLIQEKRNEMEKEWIENLFKKYNFKIYTERLKVEKNYKFYISVGNEFYKSRNYIKAEKNYKKALKLNHNAAEAKLKLALTYYKLNKNDAASKIFDDLQANPLLPVTQILTEIDKETGQAKIKLIELAGYTRDPIAIDPILEIYIKSTNILEKQSAIRSLGLLKAEKAFSILFNDLKIFNRKFAKYKKENTNILKWYLIEALGYIGNKRATPFLLTLYKTTSDQNEKCFIVETLGRLKDKRAVPLLKKALKTEVWGIRVLAAEALKKITGKEYKVEEPKIKERI